MSSRLFKLCVFIGVAVSIPMILQSNQAVLEALFIGSEDNAEPDHLPQTRIARAEIPSTPAATSNNFVTGRKARVEPDARGHFVSDFKINGRAISGMIDTGATYVALNVATARKLGVAPASADFKLLVQTANGQAKAAIVKIKSMQVGRIYVTDIDALVLEDKALSGTLIGMSFLKRISRYYVENSNLVMEQ